jgi:hypothetical protein
MNRIIRIANRLKLARDQHRMSASERLRRAGSKQVGVARASVPVRTRPNEIRLLGWHGAHNREHSDGLDAGSHDFFRTPLSCPPGVKPLDWTSVGEPG